MITLQSRLINRRDKRKLNQLHETCLVVPPAHRWRRHHVPSPPPQIFPPPLRSLRTFGTPAFNSSIGPGTSPTYSKVSAVASGELRLHWAHCDVSRVLTFFGSSIVSSESLCENLGSRFDQLDVAERLGTEKHVDNLPPIVCRPIFPLLIPIATRSNVSVTNPRVGHTRGRVPVCVRAAAACATSWSIGQFLNRS